VIRGNRDRVYSDMNVEPDLTWECEKFKEEVAVQLEKRVLIDKICGTRVASPRQAAPGPIRHLS